MAQERSSNIKLGAFVLAGTAVLVLGLYMLGSKRDLFSRTIQVLARFNEVNGLRTGNNVRYAGIDVGTVEGIAIINDTVVEVELNIRLDDAGHIRRNAIARIASDGLMGNKLVSIEPAEGTGASVPFLADGDTLASAPVLDTDAMLRSLGRSNDNVVAITTDLRALTQKLNNDRGLLRVLGDSMLAADITLTMHEVRNAATNARELTERVNDVVRGLQQGKGALGALATDTSVDRQVRSLVTVLEHVSDSLVGVADRLGRFSAGLDRAGGLGHAITRDTALVTDVKRVIANLDTSASTLTEDLRALQRNWFFRRYFKEKKKDDRER